MTTGVYTVPIQQVLNRPSLADVFVHAAAQIHQAAADLWPGEPVWLEAQVPSVTGYVHRARVGDRVLYAKTSILGVSLVSLLRGACGPWPAVRCAQESYIARADNLLGREAAQLRILAAMDRPRVCGVAGVAHGVIFTEPVTGPTLGDLVLAQPGDTAHLLARLLTELRPLHRPGAARSLDPAGVIGERSISGTFLRKFNGLSGMTYVDQLGAERQDPATRAETVERMRRAVNQLRRLRMALPAVEGMALAYGDLKPEHVVFVDGPEERPVLLDPGLLRGSPMLDVAKLISRTVLLLAARRPGHASGQQILDGLNDFAHGRAMHLSGRERRRWLRGVLTLWLMDTVNIITTYLSAPAVLPLPALGLALIDRAAPVSAVIEQTSADLAGSTAPRETWDRALTRALAVAS